MKAITIAAKLAKGKNKVTDDEARYLAFSVTQLLNQVAALKTTVTDLTLKLEIAKAEVQLLSITEDNHD